jgi:hypothetical protein
MFTKRTARLSTLLALTVAGTAGARSLTTITDKATGFDNPSSETNIDIGGTIPNISLDGALPKVLDWVRRTWNEVDYEVQLEKDQTDDAFTEPARCYVDADHASLLGAQPVTIGGGVYRTGPMVLDDGAAVDYLAALAPADPIAIPATLDVTHVRFLTGGAHIATKNYIVRFDYTTGADMDVTVPIALDSNTTRGGNGAGYTKAAWGDLTHTANAAFDKDAAGGSDCAGSEGDEIVVTNPDLGRTLSSIQFVYPNYDDAAANTGWLDGPLAVTLESDQVSLEATYLYAGEWSSSTSTADAPVDMPAHNDTAIWYGFTYNTAGLGASKAFVRFQCGNDTSGNGTLAPAELSVEERHELANGAGTIELDDLCFGRYVQYDVELYDATTTDPRLLDITFLYDADNDDDHYGADGDRTSIDCRDDLASANPGLTEVTGNDVDNDCSGSEDCFFDADNDGYRTNGVDGGGANNDTDCGDANEGQLADGLDCNDAVAAIRPGVVEIAGDNIDQNCDNLENCFTDADNDGARLTTTFADDDADCNDANEGLTTDAIDCNDGNGAINPAATEQKGDEVDQNCDGAEQCWPDGDNDGDRASTGSQNSTDTDCTDASEGRTSDPVDCNDGNGAINSSASETAGDNVDQNCDTIEDCLTDADDDGARTAAIDVGGINNDADCNDPNEGLASDAVDCNDGNAAINPAATEVKGDEIDQNCDTDETCWPDGDNDGDRASTGQVNSTDLDCTDVGEGRTSDAVDCNDGNGAIFSGALEVAGDNVDQNCNNVEDCFTDGDNDNARTAVVDAGGSNNDADCNDPNEGLAGDPTDCNDGDAAINPAAAEIKGDEVDQNCDTDETCWPDADGDDERASSGQVASTDTDCTDPGEGRTSDTVDCNDGDAAIKSTATEIAGDNVDQNCNNVENCFTDADNDNSRLTSVVVGGSNNDADCNDANEGLATDPPDCNDADSAVSPLVSEVKGNNVDNDCNGAEICWPNVDNDSDRAGSGQVNSPDSDCTDANEGETTDAVDCDDNLATRASTNPETPGNNVDNNCDNIESCFTDADNDGNRMTTVVPGGSNNDADCLDANEGEATDQSPDCNDADPSVRLGIAEVTGNNVDNNCDNVEDCFTDGDNDNARLTTVVTGGTNNDADCLDANEGQATDAIDCVDNNATINPAATEIAGDSVDQNCDVTELCFTDGDNDGARLTTTVVSTDSDCGDPNEGQTSDAIDCVDNNPAINPAAAEIKGDEVDQNCDTQETCWPDVDNDNSRANAGQQASSDVDCDDANEGATSDLVDCDDNDASRSPLLSEITGNEHDESCDGQEVCNADADNDDTHHLSNTVVSPDFDCDDSGEDPNTTQVDCDDNNANRSPLLTETGAFLANGVDNDCNGGEVCYLDDDNDDYRSQTTLVSSDADCNDTDEALTAAGPDCNDTNAAVNPGVADICGNGVDDNCTGNASDHGGLSFSDDDGDGLSYAVEQAYVFGGVPCALDDCNDDTDGDGVTDDDETSAAVRSNACSVDTDGDGLDDDTEVGLNPNNPIDTDGDGTDDVLDTDDDNDTIPTSIERVAAADVDGDGIPNYHDSDSDGDGYTDRYEWDEALGAPAVRDSDGDGDADYVDEDSDDDNLDDALEQGTQGAPADSDGDGIDDRLDDDDDDDCVPTRQELGFNSDTDGITDYLDPDDDDDGLESCDENPDNAGTPFNDNTDSATGDILQNFRDPDDDGDGIATIVEFAITRPNCINDGDSIPAHLDPDSDGDGFDDEEESPGGVLVNTDGSDADMDMCDLDSDADRVPDEDEVHGDTDGDIDTDRVDPDDDGDSIRTDLECGFPTACDSDPQNDNTDGDAHRNYLDPDDDNDGVPTLVEAPLTSDADGVPDWADTDDDDDTVLTEDELPRGQDLDADGLPNYRDNDDDGDDLPTAIETETVGGDPLAYDFDGDGAMNFLDADDDEDGKNTQCEVLWLGAGSQLHLSRDSDLDGLTDGQEWGDWNGSGPILAPTVCDEPRNTDGADDYDLADTDDDNDGLLTYLEIFANEINARSADDDCLWEDLNGDGIIQNGEFDPSVPAGDGIPDHRDTDSDNDGIPDGGVDPDTNALETFGEDVDFDGIDNLDDCDQSGCDGDTDGDRMSNAEETRACCRIREVMGDNDLFDSDLSDAEIDRMCDSLDAGNSDDGCGCGLTTTRDFDSDGVIDPSELSALSQPQPDTDADDLANVLDDDDDGDGLLSRVENLYQRPTVCDKGQWDNGQDLITQTCDLAFLPEYDPSVPPRGAWAYRCEEASGSELFVLCDELSNIDAADATDALNPHARNPDTVPNYLDDDDDGDGQPSLREQGPNDDVDGDTVVNWFDRADENGDSADADADGITNGDERELGSNPYSDDSDNDGLTDAQEGPDRDSDGDGDLDLVDPDDDNDGVPTAEEGQVDSDGDGDPDYLDTDSDDDGVLDGADSTTLDSDCDGLADAFDSEDDGVCDDGSGALQYVRGQCSCDASAGGSGMALALGALALLVRRRRVR